TLKALIAVTLPSILLYFANRDDPRWKEIPQWQKDLFWIIFTDENIYRIPKPFELGVIFGSLPERILEYIDTQDRTVLNEYADSLLGVLTPGLLPNVAQPFVENIANYSFFLDRPIVPNSVSALPAEYQYGEYTSEVAKGLGKIINYSPAMIDNVFYSWSGGLGNYAVDTMDAIMAGTGITNPPPKPTDTLADTPVVKAFVVRNPIGSSSRSVNRFYEELAKYTAGESLLKKFMAEGNKEEFESYRAAHPELLFQYDYDNKSFYSASARYLRNVTNVLAEIRKRQDIVYDSRTMSPEEKRKVIDELDTVKTKVSEDALAHIAGWRTD
ncbi:MAG: LPD38 domain-containing protein, partial [Candidatus Omnitrophota bacterium]